MANDTKVNKPAALEEAKNAIQALLNDTAYNYVVIGFHLKRVRDGGLYGDDGYGNVWEFSEEEFGLSKSTTSRFMAINDRFSEGGNSPTLSSEYEGFTCSKLQEMLYLTDEQLTEVKPENTVREIREIRKPKEGPKLSAIGEPKRVYPEGSSLTTPGCGKLDCFSCGRNCETRQEDRYCRFATLGSPFPCTVMNALDIMEKDGAEGCVFVDLELAPIRAGDKEPTPCCHECERKDMCGYACHKARRDSLKSKGSDVEDEYVEPDVVATSQRGKASGITEITELEVEVDPNEDMTAFAKEMEANGYCPDTLDSCLQDDPNVHKKESCVKCWERYLNQRKEQDGALTDDGEEREEPEVVATSQQEAEVVDADGDKGEYDYERNSSYGVSDVRGFLADAVKRVVDLKKYGAPAAVCRKAAITRDAAEALLKVLFAELEGGEPKRDQPELPKLRNNDRRKEFLLDYRKWPVWIEIAETKENFYRYDFDDGSAIVIKECFKTTWYPEKGRNWGVEDYYLVTDPSVPFRDCRTNMSELVEHLKNVQRKGVEHQ